MNILNDIYYSTIYSNLYIDKSYSLFDFEHREGRNVFKNIAIKKPINKIGNKEVKGYYDLETPYGYGGIYCNTSDNDFIKRAFDEYKERCKKENIIAEFFSFHPFNEFPVRNSNCFDISFKDREVVYLDLNKSEEDRWLDYSSKIRTIIRRCYKDLVVEDTNDIDTFMSIYYETMEKNNARGFYFFDRTYFEKLLNIEGVKLLQVKLNDVVIAMSFFMLGDEIAHYHLSANKSEYLKYNANYLILEEGFKLAKNNGCKYFLLGGGRTPKEDDNLFKFKSKFSKMTKGFYLAGNIYNKDIYIKYISIWEKLNPDNKVKYFLKYRLNNE